MKKIKKVLLYSLVLAFSIIGLSLAETYKIDPYHSDITFKIRHLMISKVSGRFEQFSGEFTYDGKDPKNWSAQAEIQAASINTSIPDRDKHLRTPDFFDVEKYPTLQFKSAKVSDYDVKNGKAKLTGLLTMHGVTKEVMLDLDIGGTIKDPQGTTRSGFEATGKINRKDFGIAYNKILDNGGLALGEEVEISIHIEGVLPKPEEKK